MNWLLDLLKSVVFQTIISGVFIFVLSQCILEFIIKPLREYKKLIAKIDNKLKFYSDVIVNPPLDDELYVVVNLSEDYLVAKQALRELSCELESSYKMLPFKKLRNDRKKIASATSDLIWLANATGQRDVGRVGIGVVNVPRMANDMIKNIRENLGISEL